MNPLPTIALIGRPNVGKSTLFNRLVGRRLALVHNRPGVTRDRRSVDASFFGDKYTFIDTPGLYDPGVDSVPEQIATGMREQTLKALNDANIICFIIDGYEGCTPYDFQLAKELRLFKKKIIILVNKSEGTRGMQGMIDAASFGLSDHIIPISAEHGEGMSDFAEALHDFMKSGDIERIEYKRENAKERPVSLTIMGRPNAGKSTLINTLLGKDEQLTGDLPGLTRDAISYPFTYMDTEFKLIDTAGIRRRSKVIDYVEKLAVMDAKRALQFSEIVVLLIDGSLPAENHLEKQDLQLAQMIMEEGRALVLAINKWDQVKDKKAFLDHIKNELTYKLSQAAGIPIITLSALHNKNCNQLLDTCLKTYSQWNLRIPTAKLNQWFDFVVDAHNPPIVAGNRIKLKYITQIKSRPPSFVVFGTKCDDVPDSYQRYLVNKLRDDFGIQGVPIRLHFKSPKNPYADKKRKK